MFTLHEHYYKTSSVCILRMVIPSNQNLLKIFWQYLFGISTAKFEYTVDLVLIA